MRPTVIKVAIVAAALLVAPLVGEAQRAEKVYRVGYLGGQSESAVAPFLAAFRPGMQELGYVEGRNLMLVARFAEGKFDRFPSLAQELVRLNPDVLFVATTVGAQAAKEATATIRSSSSKWATRSAWASSPTWHGQGGTSPGSPV